MSPTPTDTREKALEALDHLEMRLRGRAHDEYINCGDDLKAIRDALQGQNHIAGAGKMVPQPSAGNDPVAWMMAQHIEEYRSNPDGDGIAWSARKENHAYTIPLYLSPPQSYLPEVPGWKLVPIEPTPEMVEAYGNTIITASWQQNSRTEWNAMLSASPIQGEK